MFNMEDLKFECTKEYVGVRCYSRDILLKNLKDVLLGLEFDENLFQNLLFSNYERFRQVQEATERNPNIIISKFFSSKRTLVVKYSSWLNAKLNFL